MTRLLLERGYNAIELHISALLYAAMMLVTPFILLARVETPDYDIAATSPVIVPVCVVGAPALVVGGGAQESAEGWVELSEKDEIVGPLVEIWIWVFFLDDVAGASRSVTKTASHALA